MGEHARLTQERNRIARRNRWMAGGLGGILAVGAAVGVGIKIASGDGSKEKTTVESKFNGDKDVNFKTVDGPVEAVPSEIIDAERTVGSPLSKIVINKLQNSTYQEKATADIGGHKVHFASINGAQFGTSPLIITEMMKTFRNFEQSNPDQKIPVFKESDHSYKHAEVKLQPMDKTAYVLAFPGDTQFGTIGEEGGMIQQVTSFTAQTEEYPTNAKITILKQSEHSDVNIRHAGVEACQSIVNLQFLNVEDFPGASRPDIETILQEKVCNELGKAVAARAFGVPYDVYVNSHNPTDARGMETASEPRYYITFNDISQPSFDAILPGSMPADILEPIVP